MRAFVRNDQAQGFVEYALVIMVITITIIITMVLIKDQIGNFFSNVGNSLT